MKNVELLNLRGSLPRMPLSSKTADEGGCGVVGFASSQLLEGTHLKTALRQMKNRGNGKGGGIAMVGLVPEDWGVTDDILRDCYIIQIAILDERVIEEIEEAHIHNKLEVVHKTILHPIEDFADIGLRVKPPMVIQYFCHVKPDVLEEFAKNVAFKGKDDDLRDEFIYQNSYTLNHRYYASLGEKQAFVLSHSKNLLVFKLVGYADQVLDCYDLNTKRAHIWVGHHRYPTKGTVWHPGGAHPFIGMNEALIHNGDFSNYHAVSEYLAQKQIYPQFLTDTEVAALQFDLYSRIYKYPTEYVIEAMAPTTERDFSMLTPEKQEIYKRLQVSHLQGSPDGPWFFIIGRSHYKDQTIELLGITDTSMLRPQVFALYEENDVSIGLIASERQAIDATLRSISEKNSDIASKADIYWNARGGSYTDGGAFSFSIDLTSASSTVLCTDKFGDQIQSPKQDLQPFSSESYVSDLGSPYSNFNSLHEFVTYIDKQTEAGSLDLKDAIDVVTGLLDYWHLLSFARDGRARSTVEDLINRIFRRFPLRQDSSHQGSRIDFESRERLTGPKENEKFLVIDVSNFSPEGEMSAANIIVDAYTLGWKHILTFDWRGQRFCGCGLGPSSERLRIDVYGNPGDYLASGLDGAQIYVHASVQDQVGQMMKSGTLVIYGDVGQTFLYGAKGGEIFVLGNAAGRPLINAVGKPRLIINGTCLDYLAESFMAGDPVNDGGFALVNGIKVNGNSGLGLLDTPYAGGNLFSLASGGAVYLFDPNRKIESNQLHGGVINTLISKDIELITRYLETNEELFKINLLTLLSDKGDPASYFVKVEPDIAGYLKS